MSNDVRRPKEYEQMLSDLCQSDKRIFLSYKDALVFSACIGYANDISREIDKSSEPVKMHIFKGQYDEAIFNCIGIAETEDPSILSNVKEEEKIKIFERYAAAGLDILKQKVYDSSSEWDQAFLELITSQLGTGHKILEGIAHLAD